MDYSHCAVEVGECVDELAFCGRKRRNRYNRPRSSTLIVVISAKADTQGTGLKSSVWFPAFAGMTG
jgi:hypothetical protein